MIRQVLLRDNALGSVDLSPALVNLFVWCLLLTIGSSGDQSSGVLAPKGGAKVQLAVVADEESGACSPLGLQYLLQSGVISSPNGSCKGSIYAYPGMFRVGQAPRSGMRSGVRPGLD